MASSGSRALVLSPDGDTFAKLRISSGDEWEVFDDERRLLGVVELDEDGIAVKEGRTGEWVPFERNEDVWKLDGRARAEVMRSGWAIFDGSNKLVGFFDQGEDAWRQRASFSGPMTRYVGEDGVVRDARKEVLLRQTGEAVAPSIMLALSNEELDLIGAVAVGALLGSELGDEPREQLQNRYEQSSMVGPPLDAAAPD